MNPEAKNLAAPKKKSDRKTMSVTTWMRTIKLSASAAMLLLLLTLAPRAAYADRFTVNITAKITITDFLGKLRTLSASKAAILKSYSESSGEPVSNLEIIYDTDHDTVEVVKKSDGAFVAERFAFSGGATVSDAADKNRMRQAFVAIDGSPDISGSAVGKIVLTRDALGQITKFAWSGSYQASGVDSVVTGIFTTGKKFVPLNP